MIRQLLEQFGDDGRTFAHVKLRFFVSLQPHGLAYLFRFRRKKKMFFFSSCSRIQPDKSILNLHEIHVSSPCWGLSVASIWK